ncbi:MAG: hypothetical protein K8H85_18665 [Cyclobacteriaceae bacterium]|nr:hypothetical protein [Cyclobacteriaceae bacterium]
MFFLNIERGIGYITDHKTKTFWIVLLLMVGTALSMRPSSSCLITSFTPLAIVDLELAFDQQKALRIKEVWRANDCNNPLSLSSNGLEAAVVNIGFDFPFLLAYTSFLIVLIVLTRSKDLSKDSITTILIYAALLAGLLDVVENILMVVFLKLHPIPSYTFAISASMKFVLIIILIVVIIWRLIRMILPIKS